MAITKTIIESFVGDTIQYTVPVTLNGVADTDMSSWSFRVEMRLASTNAIVVASGDVTYDTSAANTASWGWKISDEQTATLAADTYKIYGKHQAPTTEDEYTTFIATVPLSPQGVD